MKMTIPEEFEDRIINLARAHNHEVEEEIHDLLWFAIDNEEYYLWHKLQERAPEQV